MCFVFIFFLNCFTCRHISQCVLNSHILTFCERASSWVPGFLTASTSFYCSSWESFCHAFMGFILPDWEGKSVRDELCCGHSRPSCWFWAVIPCEGRAHFQRSTLWVLESSLSSCWQAVPPLTVLNPSPSIFQSLLACTRKQWKTGSGLPRGGSLADW